MSEVQTSASNSENFRVKEEPLLLDSARDVEEPVVANMLKGHMRIMAVKTVVPNVVGSNPIMLETRKGAGCFSPRLGYAGIDVEMTQSSQRGSLFGDTLMAHFDQMEIVYADLEEAFGI